MRYVGGKSRLARQLAGIIERERGGRSRYVEPFLGGASVLAAVAPAFTDVVAADAVEDVALLWEAARGGWVPPTDVSREEYAGLRAASPSALRGFVGFGCSFGGKWFGGYSAGTRGDGAPSSSRSVVRKAAAFRHATILHADYRDLDAHVDAAAVVYCDPPYAGTTGYDAAGSWNPSAFWETAERWAERGALVLVSEYTAPEGWAPVWEREHRQSLQGGSAPRPVTTERVFMYVGAAA